jgi:hypothetical protein
LLDAIFNTLHISGATVAIFRFAVDLYKNASDKYTSFLNITINTPKFKRYWVRFINHDLYNAVTIHSTPCMGDRLKNMTNN